jgi:hypothetical protein
MISDPIFEQEGDVGVLTLVTHFGVTHEIRCEKTPDEAFRIGGTAISESVSYEGLILSIPTEIVPFRAFRSHDYFEGVGVLSPEIWTDADRHCFITEYYPLDIEGQSPGWLVSKHPILNPNPLFVNVDILDGGGNIMKRYRVSTFFGTYKVM